MRLFGGVQVTHGEAEPVRFRAQKAASLLGYLAYYPRAHPRELLIEQFWSDDDLQTGRHRLSVALSTLRQVLEPPGSSDGAVIRADRNTVQLTPGSYTTDVEQFERALRASAASADRADHLAHAISLYQGELLAGYYDNWIFTEQQRQAHRFLEALRELVGLQVRSGDTAGAVETALRAVAADPLSEALHQEVMRLQLALDRPAAALRHYREVERILREELDTAPSAAFMPLLRAAREALEKEAESSVAPPRAGSPSPAEAPVQIVAQLAAPAPHHGALPIGSPFYLTRQADGEVAAAIAARSSVVLLKGARQVGKTSLLGRALLQAKEAGAHVVSTDFEALSGTDLESPGTLLRALAADLVDQLDLDADPDEYLDPLRSPAFGFRKFLRREVLERLDRPLVWGLDEVDRLFSCDFYNEIFALFRSWHNQRLLDVAGPWHRLTQVIGYATETHLFITDLQQSPFNVGVRVELADFSPEQVAELNRRHSSPLRDPEEVSRLYDLLGGHPYLIQQGLSFAARSGGWEALEKAALAESGPFADHLRRLLLLFGKSPGLCEDVREVLRRRSGLSLGSFFRLRSSGVLAGDSSEGARPRCGLYEELLGRHLLEGEFLESSRRVPW